MALTESSPDFPYILHESYRHSQGDLSLHYAFLAASEVQLDSKPRVTGAIVKPLVDTVLGGVEKHVPVPRSEIGQNLKDLYEGFESESNHFKDPSQRVNLAASSLLSVERAFYTTGLSFNEVRDKDQAEVINRLQRLRSRVAANKSSFAYLYGRDSVTTGISKFDELYAGVWKEIETVAKTQTSRGKVTPELIASHAAAVRAAEIRFIGRLVLAR